MDGGSLAAIGMSGALLGGGFGLSYSFLGQRVIGSFAEAERARGSSAIGVVRNAGGALGAALAGIAANQAGFASGLERWQFRAGRLGRVRHFRSFRPGRPDRGAPPDPHSAGCERHSSHIDPADDRARPQAALAPGSSASA